ncbi:MAG: Hpt domain-containing protein [Gammaproteobacteria bacterium]
MPELSIEAQQKVLELKKAYIDSFPNKITQLNTYWKNLEANHFSEDELAELRKVCHKIAGSSASYELMDISLAAKELELTCSSNHLDQERLSNRKSSLESHFQILVNLLESRA